jgi:two-component system, sensor histidine kinase YesM
MVLTMRIFESSAFKRIANKSIIFKLLMIYVLIIVIFLGGVVMIIILDVYNILIEKELQVEDEYLEKLERAVISKYRDYYDIAIDLHSREGLANMTSMLITNPKDYWEKGYHEQVVSYLDTLTSTDRDLLDIILIPLEGKSWHSALLGSRNMIPRYDFFSDLSIREWMNAKDFFQIQSDNPSRYLMSGTSSVITLIIKIYDPANIPFRNTIGYLLLNLSPDLLKRELEQSRLNRNGDYILLNRNSQILFSTDDTLNTIAQSWEKNNELPKNSLHTEREYIFRKTILEEGEMTLVNLISLRKIKAPLYRLLMKMVLLAVLGFTMAVLIAFWVLRISSRRFFQLLSAFDRVREGHLNVRLPVTVGDEIGQLQKGFNEMCQDLGDYINRVYAVEIHRKDMENKYLQAQINPHFLYNTLEHLQSLAIGTGDAKLARMITLLGDLFRWSSRTGESIVRIEDELEHLAAYLEIQKLRFGEQLVVEFDYNEDLLDYGIPKMLLQPLVENAVIHGVGGKTGKGRILVTGRVSGDVVDIVVSDDGKGMNHTSIERYLKGDPGTTVAGTGGSSIGIANVNQRINLLFGEEFSLKIDSSPGGGTLVLIRVPKLTIKEMRDYVQGHTSR